MQNAASSAPAGTPASKQPPASGTAPPESKPKSEPTTDAPGASGGSPETPPLSKAQRLAKLLEEPGDDESDSTSAGADEGEAGGSHKAKPKKFNDLAETLGVELAELYKLEVATSADGKPVTVEMLKDHHAKRSEFSVAQLTWEEERTRQQSDLVRANSELRELLAALPQKAIDPKVLESVRNKHDATLKRERARTLEVIPAWKDEAKRTEEIGGMEDFLKRYGYPPGHLGTIYDHRALLMIRDAWRRELRVKAALEQVEKIDTTPTPKPGKPAGGKAPGKPRSGPLPRGRAGLLNLLGESQ